MKVNLSTWHERPTKKIFLFIYHEANKINTHIKITTVITRLWVTSSSYQRWRWIAKNLSTLTATTLDNETTKLKHPVMYKALYNICVTARKRTALQILHKMISSWYRFKAFGVLQYGPEFPFSRRRGVNQSLFENIPFPATPNVEKKFWSLCKTLESTFEMRLMMKFYLCIMPNSSQLSNLFSWKNVLTSYLPISRAIL